MDESKSEFMSAETCSHYSVLLKTSISLFNFLLKTLFGELHFACFLFSPLRAKFYLHLYSHSLFLIPLALHFAVSFYLLLPFDAPLDLFVLPLSCFLFPFTVTPFNPRVSYINPSYSSCSTHSLYPCPSASSYFHIPELIPLSPRLQPVVFPVSLLIRLSLALVLLIPEGFVYLCWSCFYSLRLTPPIFSPVI